MSKKKKNKKSSDERIATFTLITAILNVITALAFLIKELMS